MALVDLEVYSNVVFRPFSEDPATLELRLRGWSIKDIRVTVSAIPSFPTIWNRQSFENKVMKYDEAVVDGTNPAPPGM